MGTYFGYVHRIVAVQVAYHKAFQIYSQNQVQAEEPNQSSQDATDDIQANMILLLQKEDENKTLMYTEQRRRYGEGFVRVGSTVEPGEDIYTLGLVSQLRDSEI